MNKPSISSISIKNFKKHEDLTLDFSESVNAIMGPNWSGKSSVIQAILFCLVSVSAVPGGKAKVARRGGGKTEVTLHLSNGVKVSRTLTTASVWNLRGDLAASGHTAVNQWVEDNLFGMPAKQALTLSYAPQSETAALLTLGAPALNRLIEELARADYVERLAAKSYEDARTTAGILEAMPSPADMASLKAEVSESEEGRDAAQLTLAGAKADLDERVASLSRASGLVTKAIQVQEQIRNRDAIRAKLSQAVEQQEETSAKIVTRVDLTALIEARNAATFNLSELKSAQSDMAALKREEETCLKWLEQNPAPSQIDVDAMLQAEAEQGAMLEAKVSALAERRSAMAEVSRALAAKRDEKKNAVCGECLRPFDEAALAAASEAADRLALEEGEVRAEVRALEDQAQAAKARLAELKSGLPSETLLAGIALKTEQLAQARASLGEFEEWLEKFCDDAKMARGPISEVLEVASQSLAKADAELDTAKGKNALAEASEAAQVRARELVARLKLELAPLEGLEAPDLEGLRTLEYEASGEASKSREAKAQAEEVFRVLSERVHRAKSALETSEGEAVKRLALENRAAKLLALAKWLRESKSKFLSDIWGGILSVASEFVSLATDGYAGAISRNDDGDFSLVEGGEECPMVGASGGMRAICATGLRIGLGSLLPQGLGFLLLDEPSSELNDDNAAGLAAALRVQGHQVILVTHRDGEQFASDQTLNLS